MTRLAVLSLLLLTIMVSSASAQGGIGNCCMEISETQIHREFLKSYYVQNTPLCAIHAVVFTTIRGKRICAAPYKMWTETSKAFLDGKNWCLQRHAPRRLG